MDTIFAEKLKMVSPIEAYIRQAAIQRGMNPDIAVKVAKSEGGVTDPVRQSDYVKNGRRERSYGPFQLYMDGGLGNRALAAGIDPRNPDHWQAGVDFALDEAKRKGWGQWYGAAKVGVGQWDGIRGGAGNNALIGGTASPLADPAIADFVKNNPQPGGFGAEVENAVFGSMAPGGSGSDTLMGGTGGTAGMSPDEANAIGGLLGEKDTLGSRLEGFGKALSASMPRAPRAGGGGGDARATGNMLLDALNGPTIDQLFLKKRLGFLNG